MPRTMQAVSQKPGLANQGRAAQTGFKKPVTIQPGADTDTSNYNTFSQPDFAQPSQLPDLSLVGHSMMVDRNIPPPFNQPDSHIDISEIQAQISSVMTTQHDASQVMSSFPQFEGTQMSQGQANL